MMKFFALKNLASDHQSLYESGYFKRGANRQMNSACEKVLEVIRPQLVPFAEVFCEPFDNIPSTIGNEFGDIYQMQFETAKASSLNKAIVPDFYETHMKPVM